MEKEKIPKVELLPDSEMERLSDKDLYALCKKYGGEARRWSRKFGFLLPEVAKRRLYRKYKCESIYQFSAKLAGMNYEVTYRILHLSHKLEAMPKLWGLFPKHGWSKLKIVASIATPVTEDFWIEKVETMARPTLQLFIKELRNQNMLPSQPQTPTLFGAIGVMESDKNSLNKPEIDVALNFCTEKSVGQSTEDFYKRSYENLDRNLKARLTTFNQIRFRLDSQTEAGFRVFKSELEKARKEAVTMGETLKALLEVAYLARGLSKCMPKEHRSIFPYWRH